MHLRDFAYEVHAEVPQEFPETPLRPSRDLPLKYASQTPDTRQNSPVLVFGRDEIPLSSWRFTSVVLKDYGTTSALTEETLVLP